MQTRFPIKPCFKHSAAVFTGILSFGAPLGALEPDDVLHYRVGNVHVRPQFSLSSTYNDNIFFRSDDPLNQLLIGPKESDLINQVGPGLTFTLGENKINTLTFNYNYLHRFYADHSEVSSGDHMAGLNATITRGRVRMSSSHSLSYQTGIQGGNTSIVEQNNRISLSDQLRVNFDLTHKSDVYFTGTYGLTDQDEDSRLADISSWNTAAGYGFKYSQNLRLFSPAELRETEDFLSKRF